MLNLTGLLSRWQGMQRTPGRALPILGQMHLMAYLVWSTHDDRYKTGAEKPVLRGQFDVDTPRLAMASDS
jgi:hypothetical protein